MKVNFEEYFKNNWMVCTDSTGLNMEERIMESEVSIAISVDLTHALDIIFMMVLLYIFM